MSHEIETIAWSNTKPWHGIGTEVPRTTTVPGMLKAAQLNWTVSKRPLHYSETSPDDQPNASVPNFFALTRDSDAKVLDIVGKQYEPVQNEEAFKFFKEFVEAGKAKMETAGSLRSGRLVWGLANLGNEFTLPGDDKVKGYLLVSSPHEQGKSFRIMFTAVRVVCNNTLTQALRQTGGFRLIHRAKFDDEMISKAKLVLGIANEQFEQFADTAERLSKKKVSQKKSIEYLGKVFGLENAPADEVLAHRSKPLQYAIQALQHSPGALLPSAQGTMWGALNAVSYVTDHLLGRSTDTRLTKAWFGKTAELKRRALELASI